MDGEGLGPVLRPTSCAFPGCLFSSRPGGLRERHRKGRVRRGGPLPLAVPPAGLAEEVGEFSTGPRVFGGLFVFFGWLRWESNR